MPDARSSGRMAGGALRLPLIFAAATIAAGVLDSFLPLAKGIPSNLSSAALLVQAITATLSRWQAGKHGDRYGHARLLIPALAVAAFGMAAMMVLGSPVVLFAGMVLFGAGFGVIENATFALLIEQLPEAKASALWNLAYDAGYGAGPAVFGLICVRTGYPAAFALTGALILAAVPVALRERKAVASVTTSLAQRRLGAGTGIPHPGAGRSTGRRSVIDGDHVLVAQGSSAYREVRIVANSRLEEDRRRPAPGRKGTAVSHHRRCVSFVAMLIPGRVIAPDNPPPDNRLPGRLPSLLPGVCGPAGYAAQRPASGGRSGCAALAATRAPGHEPHDDEDGHRDQPDDEKRLERCNDPARGREGKPDGEDRAEDYPDDPAHVSSMHPESLAGGRRAGRPGPGPGLAGRLACLAGTAPGHRWSQPSRRQARDDRRPARAGEDVLAGTGHCPEDRCAPHRAGGRCGAAGCESVA